MKQTMSNLALLLAACAITVFAKPVSRLSIAPENMNRCQQPSPELLAFEKQLAAKEANGTSKFKPSENLSVVEVDVHFHVFSESEEGFKAVTDQRVNEQVDILNKAYAPSKFHFNLQSIGRTVNETWAYATYPSTDRFDFRKGNYTTLNVALTDNIIYELEKDEDSVVFIEPSGVCPFPNNSSSLDRDACFVRHDTLPGGSNERYNKGKVLIHEVGHWLGLGHTFPGYDKLVALTQADIELACEIDGDDVEDTPIQAAILADCSDMAQDSCPNKPGLDPVRNYMNYCDEDFLNEFTIGQTVRMHNMWAGYRNKTLAQES